MIVRQAMTTNTDFYLRANAHVYICKAAQNHQISYGLAGRLYLSSNGWLVLSVPASIVKGAFDALHEAGAQLPEDYSIPVMSPAEIVKIGGSDRISERGHSYKYTLGPVRYHEPTGNHLSKVWYIHINSKELKNLRHSYGLPSYPSGTSFQLPIATRTKGVILNNSIAKEALALYFCEPDWEEFSKEAVDKAISGFVKSVPDIRQETDYSCGQATLASVLCGFDKCVSEEKLREDMKPNPAKGTAPQEIEQKAKDEGYNTWSGSMTIEDLKQFIEENKPIITPIQALCDPSEYEKNDNGHYVVVTGYDKDKIYFQDPSEGYKSVSHTEFKKRWHDADTDGKIYNNFGIVVWPKTDD